MEKEDKIENKSVIEESNVEDSKIINSDVDDSKIEDSKIIESEVEDSSVKDSVVENADIDKSKIVDSELSSEDSKITKKEIAKKQNKQLMWAIILMTSMILIIVLVPYINKNIINKFEYNHLDFFKAKRGGVWVYFTEIPRIDQQGNSLDPFYLELISDPREIDSIPVELKKDSIVFQRSKDIFLSINPDMEVCPHSVNGVGGITQLLTRFGLMNVRGAQSTEEGAEENRLLFANCQSHPDNTVIMFNSGNETKIEQTSENCFEITYANCEIVEVSEKFMLEVVGDYMNLFVEMVPGY
ncbi:hypothetical protein HOD75_04835 [archaeon]|jgi:hypothetical protein|nr:hypothetical protein [archaeon]MBT4242190.1 hypothetical protein [archaeon]MBT4417878.1 hypothetical protein [archaeon]